MSRSPIGICPDCHKPIYDSSFGEHRSYHCSTSHLRLPDFLNDKENDMITITHHKVDEYKLSGLICLLISAILMILLIRQFCC